MLVVLALIVLDFWDSSCFAFVGDPPDPGLYSHSAKQADACAAFCVPDCFCCSNPAPAVSVALTEEPGPPADAPTAPAQVCTAGFSPVQDHIPISIV